MQAQRLTLMPGFLDCGDDQYCIRLESICFICSCPVVGTISPRRHFEKDLVVLYPTVQPLA